MKHQLKQIFSNGKFLSGFIIFALILLIAIFYPMFSPFNALDNILQKTGGFSEPGTYINVSEAVSLTTSGNGVKLDVDTSEARINAQLTTENREYIINWLATYAGVDTSALDVKEPAALIEAWQANFNIDAMKGTRKADRNEANRMDKQIHDLVAAESLIIAQRAEDGTLEETAAIDTKAFVNSNDIVSKYTFILGADNFGRDVLTQLCSAILCSIRVGLVAGAIATTIGTTLGLLAGFIGGTVDNIIVFCTNLFTVIPNFVLLVLISNAISSAGRNVWIVAIVIGCTAWAWTCRSVRSQVLSLRNRDHVNISKLSGHSMPRIIAQDILPFVASYVVMALILQISGGIGAEAQLSMLGLGPSTTEQATLGLMMNWSTIFQAHTNGSWWAFFPVVLSIALISFSLNRMNTGLDQIFNPQLRD